MMTRSLLAPQWLLATNYTWGAGSERAEESPRVERGASHLMKAPSRATAGVRSPGIALHKCICISSYKLSLVEKEFNKK